MNLQEMVDQYIKELKDKGYRSVRLVEAVEIEVIKWEPDGMSTVEAYNANGAGSDTLVVETSTVTEQGVYQGVSIKFMVIPKGKRLERLLTKLAVCVDGEGEPIKSAIEELTQ